MGAPVSVPLWLFAAMATLSAAFLVVHLLAPGARWLLRRRVNRVIAQINARFQVELPSFKLTRRQVLIDRLFHDPQVQAAAAAFASSEGAPLPVVWKRIDRYAKEIVPSFNAYAYFRIGYAVSRAAARALYRVRIGHIDEPALAAIDPRSTLVFVMNHRSNMDYILVAFLAAERVALSYAVGEWARIWPLQQMIRAMGGYFVRRNSGDPLYRMVLSRYVQMATEAGVIQAVFPEGGLTLDGRLRPPKLGLLDYMLKGFDEREGGERRDLVFIPVGINYDRVLEDRTQLLALRPETPRPGWLTATTRGIGFALQNLGLILTGRWHRLGYACVNFGAPISMRAYAREKGLHFPALGDSERREPVAAVGGLLMKAIGGVVPVLPVSLVASVFVRDLERSYSELELKAAALALLHALEEAGDHIYIPRQDLDYAFGVGLRMLTLRRVVREAEGLFRPDPAQMDALAYYANAIAHLVEKLESLAPVP